MCLRGFGWKSRARKIVVTAVGMRLSLEDVQVFAVLEFCVLLAEHPSEHLSGFETGLYEVSVLVPMVVTLAAVRPLQPDLSENAHQEFVDVVIDAH